MWRESGMGFDQIGHPHDYLALGIQAIYPSQEGLRDDCFFSVWV
jgi:hypothetical protein